MSLAHLKLIERPAVQTAEENANYYEQQAQQNAVLADRYRLQSLIYLVELQKANKALNKRAYQIKNLRAKVAHGTK